MGHLDGRTRDVDVNGSSKDVRVRGCRVPPFYRLQNKSTILANHIDEFEQAVSL